MSFTSNSVAAILFATARLNTMSTDPQDLMQSDWSAGLFVYSHAPVLSHGTFTRPLSVIFSRIHHYVCLG